MEELKAVEHISTNGFQGYPSFKTFINHGQKFSDKALMFKNNVSPVSYTKRSILTSIRSIPDSEDKIEGRCYTSSEDSNCDNLEKDYKPKKLNKNKSVKNRETLCNSDLQKSDSTYLAKEYLDSEKEFYEDAIELESDSKNAYIIDIPEAKNTPIPYLKKNSQPESNHIDITLQKKTNKERLEKHEYYQIKQATKSYNDIPGKLNISIKDLSIENPVYKTTTTNTSKKKGRRSIPAINYKFPEENLRKLSQPSLDKKVGKSKIVNAEGGIRKNKHRNQSLPGRRINYEKDDSIENFNYLANIDNSEPIINQNAEFNYNTISLRKINDLAHSLSTSDFYDNGIYSGHNRELKDFGHLVKAERKQRNTNSNSSSSKRVNQSKVNRLNGISLSESLNLIYPSHPEVTKTTKSMNASLIKWKNEEIVRIYKLSEEKNIMRKSTDFDKKKQKRKSFDSFLKFIKLKNADEASKSAKKSSSTANFIRTRDSIAKLNTRNKSLANLKLQNEFYYNKNKISIHRKYSTPDMCYNINKNSEESMLISSNKPIFNQSVIYSNDKVSTNNNTREENSLEESYRDFDAHFESRRSKMIKNKLNIFPKNDTITSNKTRASIEDDFMNSKDEKENIDLIQFDLETFTSKYTKKYYQFKSEKLANGKNKKDYNTLYDRINKSELDYRTKNTIHELSISPLQSMIMNSSKSNYVSPSSIIKTPMITKKTSERKLESSGEKYSEEKPSPKDLYTTNRDSHFAKSDVNFGVGPILTNLNRTNSIRLSSIQRNYSFDNPKSINSGKLLNDGSNLQKIQSKPPFSVDNKALKKAKTTRNSLGVDSIIFSIAGKLELYILKNVKADQYINSTSDPSEFKTLFFSLAKLVHLETEKSLLDMLMYPAEKDIDIKYVNEFFTDIMRFFEKRKAMNLYPLLYEYLEKNEILNKSRSSIIFPSQNVILNSSPKKSFEHPILQLNLSKMSNIGDDYALQNVCNISNLVSFTTSFILNLKTDVSKNAFLNKISICYYLISLQQDPNFLEELFTTFESISCKKSENVELKDLEKIVNILKLSVSKWI
ncbi:hypothetical protein AYI70_g1909 [Smittium culicis]|uniref:Uncharacterized protein n=1 Tax=Smittium culicis TaxID=133412 RepID=A0A1R1YAS8_9FUNG|nr:hypothetical protein AYI70_g1909 [Smittium culicis]